MNCVWFLYVKCLSCFCFYLFIFTNNINSSSTSFMCSHIPPDPKQIRHVFIEKGRVHKREIEQNLRIKYFYDESVKQITREKFNIINGTVLPEAISYWQQTLSLKPFGSPIKLSRKCIQEAVALGINQDYCIEDCDTETLCGEVVIPNNHLQECRICDEDGMNCLIKKSNHSKGVENADFVFYISTMQTSRCSRGSTIAYAAHCQQEAVFNRPIAGHANICPDSISTKPQDLETLISTFKHEILHALGFSVSLYAYYRGSSGNLVSTWTNKQRPSSNGNSTFYISNKILRKVVRRNWKVHGGQINHTVFVISTPNVVKEVRKHFNCSKLEGAELENQGEDGTLMTHWEKRLFENEAMTGTHTQNPVYSRITLALMEDTGWYKVNYSLAQPLEWGKNLGCDFAMKSCKEWIDTRRSLDKSIHPFCDKVKRDPLQTECTDNRDSVALCNLRRYDHVIDTKYQNFDYIPNLGNDSVEYYGGSVVLADYCPYIQEFTWKQNEEVVRGSKCSFPENSPVADKNFALEHYGANSKCFNHVDEMWEERSCTEIRLWQHWGSGCYHYKCSNGFLHILINNYTFICYEENYKLKIQLLDSGWLHKGTIVCPRCSELCTDCRPLDKSKLVRLKMASKQEKHFLECSSSFIATTNLTLTVIMLIIYHFSLHSFV